MPNDFPTPSPRGPAERSPLLGRERELTSLLTLLNMAERGAGCGGLIEGEAGIGKTRLLAETLAEAGKRGVRVFRGAADELERDRPFGAIADALGLRRDAEDPTIAPIAALLLGRPESVRSETPELRFRISDEIVGLVERLASETPVLLALEDLHWADPSTLLVLHHIVRRLADRPIIVLGTFRPLPRSREIDRFAEMVARDAHIVLGPLADDAVAELVANAVGAPPGSSLLTQMASAGGNPLFVTELLAALRDEGAIEVAAGTAEARSAPRPPSLRVTILRRLSFLPADTLDVLRVAATLGSSFSITDLAAVSRRTVVELASLLTDALHAGVVGEQDDRLRFRHDLIREAIYEDMPAAVRKGLHMEAARTLASAGATAVRVGEHVSLGASQGDPQAIAWLRGAAAEAGPRSPVIAVRLLTRALDLTEASHPDRTAIVAEMLEPLVWTGEAARAEQLARAVLAPGLDPAVEIGIRSGLASVLAFLGHMLPCAEAMEAGAALEGAPARDRARLAAGAASLRALFGGEEARRAAEAALDQGRQVGSRFAEAVALQTLAVMAASEGRTPEGVGLAEQALAVARHMELGEGRWDPFLIPHFWLGMILLAADRFGEAEEIAAHGIRHDEETGVAVHLVQWVPTFRRLATGDWDDAVAEMEAWIGLAEETGVGIGVGPARAMLAFVALHRNELAMAETAVAQGEAELTRVGLQYAMELVPWVRALVLEAHGDAPAAAAMLGPIWDALEPIRRLTIAHTMIDADLVRLALAANDDETARRVTSQLEEVATRSDVAGVRGAALRCRAMIQQDPAVAAEAVAAYRQSPRTLETAFTCEEAAALLPESDARDLLEEAVGIYERIGATRDLARAEAAMRARGVRRRRVTRRRRASTGWESLTETELKVVRLAAGGLTNRGIGERLFISRRTVETHLAHVFQKLGLTTRVQLAAAAVRHLG